MTKQVPSEVAGTKRKVTASADKKVSAPADENLTTMLTDLSISNPQVAPKDAVKANLFASDVSQPTVTKIKYNLNAINICLGGRTCS